VSDQGLLNYRWAVALFEGLVGAGLKGAVISPGSRSTPLTLAATLQPQLEWQVVLDERSAAFTALGMARATGGPVALVATSGSAPGNWLPAVMEANASGVPLILLSADRPWELQQCGSNQTTDQIKLFGDQVRAFHQLSEATQGEWAPRLRAQGRQLVLASRWPDPGPVHINIPFREPLVPEAVPDPGKKVEIRPVELPRLQPSDELVQRLACRFPMGPGILVCGNGLEAPEPVMKLAEKLGAPLLADPLSGLRFPGEASPNLIATYTRFLEDETTRDALRPDWILQFGAMPVSAVLQRALEHWKVETHWVVERRGRWTDPLGLGVEMLPVQTAPLCTALLESTVTREEPAWLYRWRHQESADAGAMPFQGALLQALLGSLPDQSLLFCGNSLAIRWLDAWSGSGERQIAIHGNRGLSGIDGNLSTFLGMAGSWQGSGRKVALLGDLTFQHDLGALANAGETDALIVVLNNGGGGIFDLLPQKRLPHYETCWRTPQRMDLFHVEGLFDVGFQRLEALEEFPEALQRAWRHGGVQVVEVILPDMQV